MRDTFLVKHVRERPVELLWMLDLIIIGLLVAGIPTQRFYLYVLHFIFVFCLYSNYDTMLVRADEEVPAETYRPRVAISFVFILVV